MKFYEDQLSYSADDIRKIVAHFPANKKWKYSDLVEYLPPDLKVKVEILENEIVITDSPFINYHHTLQTLMFGMYEWAEKSGELYRFPLDVRLDENNVVQPSILFVSKERKSILAEACIAGAPDLAVEIEAHEQSDALRTKKLRTYEKFGVKEYWIVRIPERKISVYCLENHFYQLSCYAQAEGKVFSKILKGFEVDWKEVFGGRE